jgi:ABC-type branched-subunit amino acid transport system substrate-binding protein
LSRIEDLTEKELRRLSRRDLLVLMLDQARQIEALRQAMQEAEERHVQELAEKERVFSERLAAQKQCAADYVKNRHGTSGVITRTTAKAYAAVRAIHAVASASDKRIRSLRRINPSAEHPAKREMSAHD